MRRWLISLKNSQMHNSLCRQRWLTPRQEALLLKNTERRLNSSLLRSARYKDRLAGLPRSLPQPEAAVTKPEPADTGRSPRASQAALLDAEIQKMERQAVLLREHQLTSEQISAVLSQEFQTAESGVEVFNAMAQANRERLAGAIANLDAAKNEAAFLERLRQAQGQNVAATLGFDSAELRDAAVAAQELGFNIQNISTPAEFRAWLDGLPAQTQDAIENFQRIQAAASNIQIGQQLGRSAGRAGAGQQRRQSADRGVPGPGPDPADRAADPSPDHRRSTGQGRRQSRSRSRSSARTRRCWSSSERLRLLNSGAAAGWRSARPA